MLDPMIPDAKQREAIDTLLSNKSTGALIAADPGTGKTLIATQYVKESGAGVVLLIAPVQTMGHPLKDGDDRHKGWNGTVDRQQIGLKFRRIDSSPEGQKALADLKWGAKGFYAVGHEMFVNMGWEKVAQKDRKGNVKKKWDKKKKVWVDDIRNVRTDTWDIKADVIIFDEVHRTSNGSSATFKTLMGFGPKGVGAPKASMKLGMSGTYEGNSFDGAWSVTRWIWPHLIDASIYVWRAKWAAIEYDHFAVRNQKVVGELNPGAFVSHLPCYIHIEADFNIKVISRDYNVDLYPEQRKVYDQLEQQMVAWIKDNPLVVKFPHTKRIRQRQATLGLPALTYLENGDVEVWFDDECLSVHIDTLPSILEDFFENESALIFTDSQQFARVVTYRLNKMYGEDAAREWSGKVSRKKRDADMLDFLDGKYKYFVAVIKASGTGTDGLQWATRNVLYLSSDDSRIENEQSLARAVRPGQGSDFVRVARLIAKDTIDGGQRSKHIEEALAANRRARRKK